MIATIFVDHENHNKFMKSEMTENNVYRVGDIVTIGNTSYNVAGVIKDNHFDYSSIIQFVELIIAKEFEDVAGSY